MTRRRIYTSFIALAAAAIFATMAFANLSTGVKAPIFSLPTLDGKTFILADNFKNAGKVVVLDIWATWCPPCRAEIPQLIDLQKKLKGKDVTFAGVALDDEKGAVADFAKSQGINYTIALDPSGNKLGRSYKIEGIPATYIIDKKGVIRYTHSGFPKDKDEAKKEAADIEREIRTLLAK